MQWLNESFIKISNVKDLELYIIAFLCCFILWLIFNTIKFYKGQRRKVKHLHRFARKGETISQYELAKLYAKGQTVRKSYQNAAFLSQKAAFSGDKNAQKLLDKILKSHRS